MLSLGRVPFSRLLWQGTCVRQSNPNVLTDLGSESEEHSQVTEKPELCLLS